MHPLPLPHPLHRHKCQIITQLCSMYNHQITTRTRLLNPSHFIPPLRITLKLYLNPTILFDKFTPCSPTHLLHEVPLFAYRVDGSEALVELSGWLAVEFCVGMTFVGGSLAEDKVFCCGVLDRGPGGDLVSGWACVELLYVAVM